MGEFSAPGAISTAQSRRTSLIRLLKQSGCKNPRIANSTEEILAILRLGRVRHESFMQSVESIGNISSHATPSQQTEQNSSATLLNTLLEAKGRVVNEQG